MSLFSPLSSRRAKTVMVAPADALPGHAERPFPVPSTHAVLGTPLEGPWPEGTQVLHVAMGCFWGAEREFWTRPGVVTTAVGYMGGYTPNPTYEESVTALTGHTETVLVAYDPAQTSAEALMKVFWEAHDPTQVNRQGNDLGTEYRSAVYWTTQEQRAAVEATRAAFEERLLAAGLGRIATEIRPASEAAGEVGTEASAVDGVDPSLPAGPFYYAEGYHQQYLHKVPNGYCGLSGTGVTCPVGVL